MATNPLTRSRIVVIQARLESQRRSDKGLALIGRQTLLTHVVERALAIPRVDKCFVATTNRDKDDELIAHLHDRFENQIQFIRGSSRDVQSRFLAVIDQTGPCNMARITADDPFKDPLLYAQGFTKLEQSATDYVSIGSPPMPLGLDIEVFTTEALLRSRELFPTAEDREHVTLSLFREPNFTKAYLQVDGVTPSDSRLTVDYEEDIVFTSRIAREIDALGGGFDLATTLAALDRVEKADKEAG